jgi:carbon monoxide dehydrogenase subunit G
MLRFRHRMAMLATLFILSQPAAFGEAARDQDLTVDVKKNDGMLVVDVDMFVGASPSEAWAVLTDYDHMAQFLPNLRSSKVIEKANGKIKIDQSGAVSYGFLSMPFEVVREIELRPETEILSHAISGSLKKESASTRLQADGSGARIFYHSESVPNVWVPPGIGPAFIKDEVHAQFENMRSEIMKRKRLEEPPQ